MSSLLKISSFSSFLVYVILKHFNKVIKSYSKILENTISAHKEYEIILRFDDIQIIKRKLSIIIKIF